MTGSDRPGHSRLEQLRNKYGRLPEAPSKPTTYRKDFRVAVAPATVSSREKVRPWLTYRRLHKGASWWNLSFPLASVIGVALLALVLAAGLSGAPSEPFTAAWILFTIAWAMWTLVTFAWGESPPVAPTHEYMRVTDEGREAYFTEWERRPKAWAHLPPVSDSQASTGSLSSRSVASALGDSREWREAEQMVSEWLRLQGERAVEVGRGTRDGGVDVRTERLVVEVKHWNGKVSGPAVRQIAGVAAAENRRAAVVAKSGFTADAASFAERAGVALFSYEGGYIDASNKAARDLFSHL